MAPTMYERGYLDGYRDGELPVGETTTRGEERAEEWDVEGTPPEEGDYWIGYFHGKHHRAHGQPPAGAEGRVPARLRDA